MRGRAEQFSSPNYLLRMCLAGFGINIPQGINRALDKARVIVNKEAPDVPRHARRTVKLLSQQALVSMCRSA